MLHTFAGGSDGAIPSSGLTFDSAGNLYGVATRGGMTNCVGGSKLGCGVVFQISPTNEYTVLYAFGSTATDAAYPGSRPLIDATGTLYGTTVFGGSANLGAFYTLTPPSSPGGAWTVGGRQPGWHGFQVDAACRLGQPVDWNHPPRIWRSQRSLPERVLTGA